MNVRELHPKPGYMGQVALLHVLRGDMDIGPHSPPWCIPPQPGYIPLLRLVGFDCVVADAYLSRNNPYNSCLFFIARVWLAALKPMLKPASQFRLFST
jgi:hypothetical protein